MKDDRDKDDGGKYEEKQEFFPVLVDGFFADVCMSIYAFLHTYPFEEGDSLCNLVGIAESIYGKEALTFGCSRPVGKGSIIKFPWKETRRHLIRLSAIGKCTTGTTKLGK